MIKKHDVIAAIAFCEEEGGRWIKFRYFDKTSIIHALLFSNGVRYDVKLKAFNKIDNADEFIKSFTILQETTAVCDRCSFEAVVTLEDNTIPQLWSEGRLNYFNNTLIVHFCPDCTAYYRANILNINKFEKGSKHVHE